MTSNDANEVLNEERGKVVTDNLKKAGWSLGLVSALDLAGPNDLGFVDAHGDGKRFIVPGDAYSERKSEHATMFSDLCSCLLTKEIR
jgi:hypothetical protein